MSNRLKPTSADAAPASVDLLVSIGHDYRREWEREDEHDYAQLAQLAHLQDRTEYFDRRAALVTLASTTVATTAPGVQVQLALMRQSLIMLNGVELSMDSEPFVTDVTRLARVVTRGLEVLFGEPEPDLTGEAEAA